MFMTFFYGKIELHFFQYQETVMRITSLSSLCERQRYCPSEAGGYNEKKDFFPLEQELI